MSKDVQAGALSEKVDWDLFSRYEDLLLEEFIDRLDSFFKSRGLVFSYKELYAGFAACISKHAFLKYLAVQRDQDPLFLRLMGTFRVDVVQPINCGKFLDLGMFFRHPLFYDVFVGSGSVGKFPSVKSRKRASTASIVEHLRLKNYGLSDYGTEVIQIVCTILANKNEIFNATRPILGLGSSHGIYSPSGVVGLLKCLRSGGELILVQPGLIHSQAKYIYQVKYEQNISTKYLSWLSSPARDETPAMGSMYSYRGGRNHRRVGRLIILPQVPRGDERPFSFYWSSYGEFQVLWAYLEPKISKLVREYPNIVLRVKEPDKAYYRELFKRLGWSVVLESADINLSNQDFPVYDVVYCTYFSTAIMEAFYKGSRVEILFDCVGFKLHEDYEKYIEFFEDEETCQDQLKTYLDFVAKKTNPEIFCGQLREML